MPNPTPRWILATILLVSSPVAAHAAVAVDVSAGGDHACALSAGGAVSCWGYNFFGQLGTGDTSDRLTPAPVVGLGSGVAALSAGYRHGCVVTLAGGVKCWGYNQSGMLGDGTTTMSTTPVDVVGLTTGAAAVAAGNGSTCALTTGGGVKCWGSLTSSTTPDSVGPASGVVAVDVGDAHACTLTDAGAVKCWGQNQHGQVGDGTTINRVAPVDVTGLGSGVVAITAGVSATCALTSSGGVKCWGLNQYGSVGDGTNTDRLVPTDVVGLASGVARITSEIDGNSFANATQTCAVTTAGALWCWGGGAFTPVPVNYFAAGVDRIAAGAGLWVVTTGGDLRVAGFPRQGSRGRSGYGPLASGRWRAGCVLGFGDEDGDALCESYDACDSEHVRQRFPVFNTPKSKITLSRINTETVPGNDQMILRGRFELPAGKSFADLAPGTTGARVVLVSPQGVSASFALPAGTYGGRGTAGWSLVPAGKPRWEFKDSTGAPGTKTITTLKLTDYGPGTIGGIVDVNLTARAGSFPIGPDDLPLEVLVLLDDSVSGAAGLCGQGAFDCECRFAVSGKTLNCHFGLRRGFACF